MESLDSREAVLELVLELLAEDEFRRRPVGRHRAAGLPARLPEQLEQILEWARGDAARPPPLTVRLVKGAYWDHELVQARQHGWPAPVFEVKADCDRNFEALTRHAARARARASAWRSPRTTCARCPTRSPTTGSRGGDDRDLELQVLRGLGDELQDALAARGFRVRTYCPVGDLVAGMAYLVRRLLENTSNESFLPEQARGVPLEQLLAAP